MSNQPKPDEFSPFHQNYITKVPDGDIVDTLTRLKDSSYTYLSNIPADKADYAYAEGKWTIKEVVGHMIDAERTFAYRILAFSRGQEELPGFDENTYVELSTSKKRTLTDLVNEFKAVREANLYLYRSLTPEQLLLTGMANGSIISIRALLYIAAGHEIHHLNLIKDRYLV
ncbi:MAG: DinB family protein [Mucilaginibacter sp.]